MESTINILHLTDSHIRESNKDDINLRVASMINYIQSENIDIDLLAFTGDLAFSGEKIEYELFEKYVIDPVRKKLNLGSSKIIIIPGNHDVSREKITIAEHSLLRLLSTSRDAEAQIKGIKKTWNRLYNFQSFQNNYSLLNKTDYHYKEYSSGLFSTRIYIIKGVSIGVACLNTAWLCSGDDDKNRLFLSEYQIRKSIEGIQNCNLKIALCHHPVDWLHSSENELTIIDLKREFQLILTGHMHEPISLSEGNTTSHSICLTGRAIFDGKTGVDVDDGFHIYKLNLPESRVTALYRKYVRRRNTYDKDTDHAQGGEHDFPLQVPLAVKSSSALIVHKLAADSLIISKEIHAALAQLQGTETPVFVSPKMRSFKFKGGIKRTIENNISISDLFRKNIIVCGGKDSGKTILLKTLVSESEAYQRNSARPATTTYLSAHDIPDKFSKADLLKILEMKLGYTTQELLHVDLTITAENISSKTSEFVSLLSNICKENGWFFVVVVGSVLADVLAQNDDYKNVTFVEVQAWGPSRIREFANKSFSGTQVNAEHAYKFVSECLRTVDLPATPTVVSLYMSIFPRAGSEISSLSFLRLLEKIEQTRLGSNEPTTIESLYNRRKILQEIALTCLAKNDLYIERDEAIFIINKYFIPKKLTVNCDTFISSLAMAGILRNEGSTIGFTNFAFFDYYIALSFKDKLLIASDYTKNLQQCERVTSSLSLFAGLERENIDLLHSLIETMESKFVASGELKLKDLDSHISELLMPENRKVADADMVATENLEARIDYDEADEQYEKQKKAISENRRKLMKAGIDGSASELSTQIRGLHSFYSIFKNLENIDGEWKEVYLERILDFHITTNFALIDFSVQFSQDEGFRTLAAYLLTWTGHGFMSSALGNPTLSQTICDVIEKTQNDFKQFLLLLLLSDLRDPRALGKMELFVDQTESRAATEIMFLHFRNRLVDYEEREIPISLIAIFKKIFIKRQTRFNGAKTTGSVTAEFNEMLKKVNIEHWRNYRDISSISVQ